MNRRLWRAVAVAASVVLLGSGCRDLEKRDNFSVPNFLQTRPERPLADIPVPVGFALKSNGSYVFDGNYRVAKLLYRGTPHVDECIQYYKAQMPQSRWALAREVPDERVITFYNEGEECEIRLNRVAGITSLDIVVKPRRV